MSKKFKITSLNNMSLKYLRDVFIIIGIFGLWASGAHGEPFNTQFYSDTASIRCVKCDSSVRAIKQKAVILIHGLASSSDIWANEIQEFSRLTNTDIYVVDFSTSIVRTGVASAHGIAKRLSEIIDENQSLKNSRLIIVAHSLGGIVALNILVERTSKKQISHLVLLGSPIRGSPYANVPFPATAMLSEQVKALLPDGDDLTNLNLRLWQLAKSPQSADMPKMLSIAGRQDVFVPPTQAYLSLPGKVGATNLIFDAGHSELHELSTHPTLRRMVFNFIEDDFDVLDFEENEPIKTSRVTLCLKDIALPLNNISGDVFVNAYYSPSAESLQEKGYFLLEEENRTYFQGYQSTSSWIAESCPTIKTCNKTTGQCTTEVRNCTRTPATETKYTEIRENSPRLWVDRTPSFYFKREYMSYNQIMVGLQNEGIKFKEQNYIVERMNMEANDDDYLIAFLSNQLMTQKILPETFISVLFRPTALKTHRTNKHVYLHAPSGSLPIVNRASERCFVVSNVLPGEYSLDLNAGLKAARKVLNFHNVYFSKGGTISINDRMAFYDNDTQQRLDILIDEPYSYIEW